MCIALQADGSPPRTRDAIMQDCMGLPPTSRGDYLVETLDVYIDAPAFRSCQLSPTKAGHKSAGPWGSLHGWTRSC